VVGETVGQRADQTLGQRLGVRATPARPIDGGSICNNHLIRQTGFAALHRKLNERTTMWSRERGGAAWIALAILAGLLGTGCGHSISVSSGAAPPAPPPGPEFEYVSNTGDDMISIFQVDAKSGTLSHVGQVAAETGSGLMGIAADSHFLYAADPTTSEILEFKINQKNGGLTPTAQGMMSTGAGTEPLTLAMRPGGRALYVVDFANAQIFQFSINTATGALAQIGGGPKPTGGAGPVSVAVAATGSALFVANVTAGTIAGITIAANGTLTTPISLIGSLGGATLGTPNWLAADPSGAVLYDADGAGGPGGSVVAFTITGATLNLLGVFATGNLTNAPLSVAINPTIPFAYAANGGNDNVSSYMIQPSGLSSASLILGIPSANSIITDILGTFLYVTENSVGEVFQGAIDQTTGAVTLIGTGTVDTEVPANPASSPFQVISVELPAPS
jgi:6-phosphogluconolactonase (cycloisomerase 2 family)